VTHFSAYLRGTMDSRIRAADNAGLVVSEDISKVAAIKTTEKTTKVIQTERFAGKLTTWLESRGISDASPYLSNVHPSLGCSI